MRALGVLPPLGWTLVIAWFSMSGWGAAETATFVVPVLRWLWPGAAPEQLAALHWLVRKAAHATEYGVLAALWRGALASHAGPGPWRTPLALSILTAALDELHQATTLTRTGNPADVLLDAAAAGAVLIALGGRARSALRWLTGALLWLAAAGGTALLALNWIAGAPSGWLRWSAPASWIALVAWLLRRRRREPFTPGDAGRACRGARHRTG
jgi:VanZ family protein